MSETSDLLAETTRRLLESLDAGGADWTAVEDTGLPLALVPEEAGGFGVDPREALALIRLTGRHAPRLPIAETMIANAALAAAGLPLAEGPAALLPDGDARAVAYGRMATTLVVEDATGLVRMPAGRLVAEGYDLAGNPEDALDATGARQIAQRQGPPLLALGALARALQMTGALERILELTVEHVSTRVQFGRPLAKFQAIQQSVALLAGEAVASSAAADHAADTYAAGGDLWFAVSVARARIGEATGKATSIAHQLHGAIGFTQEHALHRFTTALWAWRDQFGSQRFWTIEAGKHALGAGREGYWQMVTAA